MNRIAQAVDCMRVLGGIVAAAAFVLALSIDPAMAADPPASAKTITSSDGWHFTLETYGWAFGMYGTVGFGRQEANVSSSFIDILQKSNSLIGFQGHVEVQHDRFGFYFDGNYADIDADFKERRLSTKVEQQLAFLETGAFFRFVEGLPLWHPSPEFGGGTITVDGLMGARYTYLNLDTQNSLHVFDRTFKRDFSGTQDWVDPIVGGRMLLRLTDGFDFLLRGDVGGFGTGSDFTWNTQALLGYHFSLGSALGEAWAGYRAMGQDYHSGSGRKEFKWDVIFHGPIIGFTVRW